MVRKENKENPLCLGPVLLHQKCYICGIQPFFSITKSNFSTSSAIDSFEIRLGKNMLIGSDEEKALVDAFAANFPASNALDT